MRALFDHLPFGGDVLEIAPGTGYWTELIAARAHRVTALDGSAEMIAINRARLGERASLVDYQQVNLFGWEPDRRWDGLVFCFWISHVPRDGLGPFFARCRNALVQGAMLFFLDGQRVAESTAVDHVLPAEQSEVMVRKLNDGRQYRIVKNFHAPAELIDLAAAAHIALDVHYTDTFFQFGVGTAQ